MGNWSEVKCCVTERCREVTAEDIQDNGKASIVVWGRGMVNNEKPRNETGGKLDEDVAMDAWSHEESKIKNEHMR